MERQEGDLLFCQRTSLEHQNSKARRWSATEDCHGLRRQLSAWDKAAASGNSARSGRRGASPAGTSSSSCFERPTWYTGNYERTRYRKPVSHFFSPLKFSISHENRVILCVGESAFIYSPSKVKAFQAPSHSLLPWKWPLCHKQVPVFTGRDSRSAWVLKWVKGLVFMYFLLLIKHKRAQILHTQLTFKTISNLSFPDTHLPSSCSQSPVKKARKKRCFIKNTWYN